MKIKPIKNQLQKGKPNLDISTWEDQIKLAIKSGSKPEECMWGDRVSEKADKEIIWKEKKLG